LSVDRLLNNFASSSQSSAIIQTISRINQTFADTQVDFHTQASHSVHRVYCSNVLFQTFDASNVVMDRQKTRAMANMQPPHQVKQRGSFWFSNTRVDAQCRGLASYSR
jgi:hypothetical protein